MEEKRIRYIDAMFTDVHEYWSGECPYTIWDDIKKEYLCKYGDTFRFAVMKHAETCARLLNEGGFEIHQAGDMGIINNTSAK